MSDMLKLGRVKKADTLEELAKIMNVPYDHLKASVDEYNKAIENKGKPDKYGFIATNTDDAKMVEGPWYACKKVPTVHHTMGGVHINTEAQVLGKNGQTDSWFICGWRSYRRNPWRQPFRRKRYC